MYDVYQWDVSKEAYTLFAEKRTPEEAMADQAFLAGFTGAKAKVKRRVL